MVDFQLSEKEKRLFECLGKQSKSQRSVFWGNEFFGALKYLNLDAISVSIHIFAKK